MKLLRKEYRIILPITVDEYKIGQLYSIAEASKNETGGGEGVEVIENKPYSNKNSSGQYTKKLYRLQSRVPKFLKAVAPKGSMDILEEAWNAYPMCKTVISNPTYMADNFEVIVQTLHLTDFGESENVHKLPESEWSQTEIIHIDIANNELVNKNDYRKEIDPALFASKTTGRGPLGPNWIQELKNAKLAHDSDNTVPLPAFMCAYKLVSCRFKWFGLQTKVENFIHKFERRVFTNFHRQVFCWMDLWHGLTMEDIRKLEAKAKEELDDMRSRGSVRGTITTEDN